MQALQFKMIAYLHVIKFFFVYQQPSPIGYSLDILGLQLSEMKDSIAKH